MNQCPICDTELKVTGLMHEDGREECPHGHYYYTHSYGAHEEHIDLDGTGHICMSVHYGWRETDEENRRREHVTNAFIEYCRWLRK